MMTIPGYDTWKLASPETDAEHQDLEPCPFCGGRAEVDDGDIYCEKCGARMPDIGNDFDENARRWNIRK